MHVKTGIDLLLAINQPTEEDFDEINEDISKFVE
jgi:hypothetical protein